MGARVRSRKSATGRAPAPDADGRLTRERILDAAERVFSRKGFDGSRVDEIAGAAGVNKALIYYYFESKKDLLEELVGRVLRDLVAEKKAAFASSRAVGRIAPGEVPDELMRRGLELTGKRMPIFGILCGEAFKNDDEAPALFRVLDRYLASLLPMIEKAGLGVRSVDEVRFAGVFFGLAPMVFFQLLKEKWIDYYGSDRRELEEMFYSGFAEIYRAALGWKVFAKGRRTGRRAGRAGRRPAA